MSYWASEYWLQQSEKSKLMSVDFQVSIKESLSPQANELWCEDSDGRLVVVTLGVRPAIFLLGEGDRDRWTGAFVISMPFFVTKRGTTHSAKPVSASSCGNASQ